MLLGRGSRLLALLRKSGRDHARPPTPSPPPPNSTPRDTHVSRRTDPPEGEGRELHVRRGHHRQCWADRVEVGGHRGRLRAKEPQRDAGARAARQEIGQEEAVESSTRCRVVVWGRALFRGGSTSIDSDLNRPPTKCHEVALEGGAFFFFKQTGGSQMILSVYDSGYFLRHTHCCRPTSVCNALE